MSRGSNVLSELEEILVGTSWTIERYIDSDKPTYVAIFRKRVM